MAKKDAKEKTTSGSVSATDAVDLAAGDLWTFALEYEEDRKTMRWATGLAILFHAVLLIINIPNLYPEPRAEAKKPRVYVVQQVRFKPPPPKQEKKIPKPKSKKVPIPDPTPDEPEPIRLPEPEEEIEIPDIDDLVVGIPDAPPEVDTGPIYVTGDVQKPVKIAAPQPQYTEIARKARIQGVVIVQAIIDKEGSVTNVKVLKGLPMGLSEAAVQAIKKWQFKPATLNGKPVAVYFNLTVNFQLQ